MNRLARVHAHPDAKALALRPGVGLERALGGNGGRNGVPRTLEGVEERVALRVELAAAARAEGVADDPPVLGERLGVAVAEPLEQARRPLDVGEDEGDGAAVELAHADSRSASSASARRRLILGFASFTISSR